MLKLLCVFQVLGKIKQSVIIAVYIMQLCKYAFVISFLLYVSQNGVLGVFSMNV